MTFNPAGTVTLRPAATDLYDAPQEAGVASVTPDSTLTLASLTIQGDTTTVDLLVQNYLRTGVTTGITAKAGGTQDGTQLTEANNYISVCATAGDSVVLPVAAAGMAIYVRNGGAKDAQVFGVTPATINGVATATGVPLTAGTSATYRAATSTTWFT